MDGRNRRAETDNAYGMAGVGYAGVSVMPVMVLGADGTGQDTDIIKGVVYAANHGADVILMAFSNPGYSPALQAAIDYAWAQGAVLVAATGNDGSSSATFPAGDQGVIGVSPRLTRPMSSPGSPITVLPRSWRPRVSTSRPVSPGGTRATVFGTSAAAAHVAGAAALLAGPRPRCLEWRDCRPPCPERRSAVMPVRPAMAASTWHALHPTAPPMRFNPSVLHRSVGRTDGWTVHRGRTELGLDLCRNRWGIGDHHTKYRNR